MMNNWKSAAFRTGVKTSLPSLFGIAAWGVVVGIAMIKTGLGIGHAIIMTLVVFAGSAQLAALPLMLAHTPVWVVFATALIVNLRFLIMSALIAPRFAHLSWIRRVWLGFLTGDVTVALFTERYPEHWQSQEQAEEQHAFLNGLILPNWTAWQLGSLIGISLGTQVPSDWGLGFAGTLAILCVMLPLIRSRAALTGVVVASVLAIALFSFPYKLGLLIAVVIGMFCAMWVEERGADGLDTEFVEEGTQNAKECDGR